MAENAVKEVYDAPEVDTDAIKCKGCGSNMTFDPATQKLKCSYCGYTEEFDSSSFVQEIAIEEALRKNEKWSSETTSFRCDNCGAKITAGKSETATMCPFCGTAHVVKVEDLEGIKPNVVIPFKIGKESIIEKFKTWAKKKLFAPGDFKKNTGMDKVKGVYMPVFTFDSNTNSVYEGRIGERRTRTVRTKNGTRTETYIAWRYVNGTLAHFFDDVYVNASEKLNAKTMKKLSPFDKNDNRVYSNEYLSGFYAYRYEKGIDDCWSEARGIMDKQIKQFILDKYGCDVVDYLNISTSHSSVTFKYVLLPVYLITYAYKNKAYTVYCNGSTGKIVGKTPVSPWKVALAVLGIAVIAVGIYFLTTL